MAEFNNTPRADEVSLKDLVLGLKEVWAHLLSKWKIILALGVVGGLLGLAYSITKKKLYVAELSFSVIEKGGGGGGLAALAGQFGLSGVGGGSSESVFTGANIPELLQSRNMLERTLLDRISIDGKPGRLIDYYMDLNPPLEGGRPPVDFPRGQPRASFSREQDSTLNEIRLRVSSKKLEIGKPKKGSSIVTLSFKDEDETFAKVFTETLMKEVSDFYVQTKTRSTRSNIESMQRSADSIRVELDKALTGRAKLVDQNLNLNKQVVAVAMLKYQTQIELLGATYAELSKNLEILKLDLLREMPLIQIIDSPRYPLKVERLGKAKGMVLGGFLAGFLAVAYLLAVWFMRKVMCDEI